MRLVDADPYENLREVLHPGLAALPPHELEAILAEHGLDAEGLNDFFGAVQHAGQQIAPRLPGIAQGAMQGASMGAAAGPYGALFGALAGGLAGGLTAPAQPGSAPPAAQPAPVAQPPLAASAAPAAPAPLAPGSPVVAPPPIAGTPLPPLGGGSPAAAQLLALIMQPQVLQALMAMMLGAGGSRSVPVAGASVPVAAIPNTLSVLANKAASEYNEVFNAAGEGESAYLYGPSGELAFDLSDPAARAEAVVRLFARDVADEARPAPPRRARTAPPPEWVEAATYDEVYA